MKDQKVVIVGMTTTGGDVAVDIVPHASKVYVAHRRGAIPVVRERKGTPLDLQASWRRRMITHWADKNMPSLYRWCMDTTISVVAPKMNSVKLDPAWRLQPFPSLSLKLPSVLELMMPLLEDGRVESLHGVKRFLGGQKIEFDDGTVLDDVGAVICCTGYKGDFSLAPFLETSMPAAHGYAGEPLQRLYMNMFPPKYADSCAMLCYSAYGKNNGFSFADVTSMAISNAWRGVSPDSLPPRAAMDRWIDDHQGWVAAQWAKERYIDVSMVRQFEFQAWLHEAAGTGMENLGWGWKGWKFWWEDREMYNLLNNGVETAHMFRYFETGKRPVWPEAKAEIKHQNGLVQEQFYNKKNKGGKIK